MFGIFHQLYPFYCSAAFQPSAIAFPIIRSTLLESSSFNDLCIIIIINVTAPDCLEWNWFVLWRVCLCVCGSAIKSR